MPKKKEKKKKIKTGKKRGYLPYENLLRRNSFDDKHFYKVSSSTVQKILDRIGKAHKLSKFCLTLLKCIEIFNLFR